MEGLKAVYVSEVQAVVIWHTLESSKPQVPDA